MLELRKQVYEANMELYRNHLAPLTWGNVSQVDRSLGVMAIKPSGVPYERLSAEDITVVSLETGERVAGHLNPSSDTPTHLALYRAFPGIGGITHTHSPYATAWAQAGRPLRCLGTTHADCFYGEVPVTRYVSREEAARAYEAETGTVIVEAFAGRDPVHTPGVLLSLIHIRGFAARWNFIQKRENTTWTGTATAAFAWNPARRANWATYAPYAGGG